MKANVKVWRNLKFLSSNNFTQAADLPMRTKRMYDVLSYQSNSYYFQREAFKTQVGDGEGPMPVLEGSQPNVRLCRRITRERKFNETDIVQETPTSISDIV